MHQIEEFVDQRQKSWCIYCGECVAKLEISRDHVPSKCLLKKPYPENLAVVNICRRCNGSFALDEEYAVAFLGSVLAGSTDPERQSNPSSASILRRNATLRARIECAKTERETLFGDSRQVWKPERERIDRVILKNARGHVFFEYGEPMLSAPAHIWAAPLEALTPQKRANFEHINMGAFWPEVGSRKLTRVATGLDLSRGWVVVQDGVYRYTVDQAGGMLVRAVLCEYLATEVCWGD